MLKNNNFTRQCLASKKKKEYSGAMQVDRVCFTVVSDTRLNYLCNHTNSAVYLWGERVSFFPTLVPRLLIRTE